MTFDFVKAACSLGVKACSWKIQDADNNAIFQVSSTYTPAEVRSISISIQLTPIEADVLFTPGKSPEEQLEVFKAMIESNSLSVFKLPEIGHSRGLIYYLESWLGHQFYVFSSESLLDKPLCEFASSKLDIVFYNKDNFVVNSTLIGGVIPMEVDGEPPLPTLDPEEHTILGMDKLAKSGESQPVAGMLLFATHLGRKAVVRGQQFNKCAIYGFCRQVRTDPKNGSASSVN